MSDSVQPPKSLSDFDCDPCKLRDLSKSPTPSTWQISHKSLWIDSIYIQRKRLVKFHLNSGRCRPRDPGLTPTLHFSYTDSDWLVWSPFSPRDSQESSPTPQFKSINSSALSFLYDLTLTSIHDYWKNHGFDYTDLCWQSDVSLSFFLMSLFFKTLSSLS